MNRIKTILLATLFITACTTDKNINKNSINKNLIESKYTIVDEGTICVERVNKKLIFTYFPLSKVNFPISQYKNFETYMYLTPRGADFIVETITSYTKINTNIATADFTSYVKRKKIYMDAKGAITIHWGFTKLDTFSNKIGDIVCYKKEGKNVSKDYKTLETYKQLKSHYTNN